MTELYSVSTIDFLKRKNKVLLWVAGAIFALSTAACILMIVFTRTGNAAAMQKSCVITACCANSTVLYLVLEKILPNRREYRHEEGMLKVKRETVTGRVTISDDVTEIPDSIGIVNVKVETGNGPQRYFLNRSKTKELKSAGEELTLQTAHGYVVAYEVAHGDS